MVKMMKAMKHILPLILMVCLSTAVHAQKDVPSTAKVTASAAETDSPLKAKAHELDSIAMRLPVFLLILYFISSYLLFY